MVDAIGVLGRPSPPTVSYAARAKLAVALSFASETSSLIRRSGSRQHASEPSVPRRNRSTPEQCRPRVYQEFRGRARPHLLNYFSCSSCSDAHFWISKRSHHRFYVSDLDRRVCALTVLAERQPVVRFAVVTHHPVVHRLTLRVAWGAEVQHRPDVVQRDGAGGRHRSGRLRDLRELVFPRVHS